MGQESAGVAIARGDASADRDRNLRAHEAMMGNPLDSPGVNGPGGVLDGGFQMFRFRFGRLIALAATIFLPIQLLELLGGLVFRSGSASPTAGDSVGLAGLTSDLGGGGGSILVIGARATGLCVLGIAVGHLAAAWLAGEDRTYRETLVFALRRVWVAPVIVGVGALVKLPLSCVMFVGFFLGDALLMVAGIAAGAEGLGPFASVGRSFGLARGVYGLALVVSVGSFVITQILQVVLTVGPVVLLSSFALPEGWLIVLQQAASLVLLVAMPVTACIAARAYVEFRCRTEGLDIERRAIGDGLV